MMTALGRSELLRTYLAIPGCRQDGAHLDRRLGLDGFLTRQATRLVYLIGDQVAFAPAARTLASCGGWAIGDETFRTACQSQAGRIAAFHATPAAVTAFAEAEGVLESLLDATTTNTTRGGRDLRWCLNGVERLASSSILASSRRDRPSPPPSPASFVASALRRHAP